MVLRVGHRLQTIPRFPHETIGIDLCIDLSDFSIQAPRSESKPVSPRNFVAV